MDEIGEQQFGHESKGIKISTKTGLSKKFLILPRGSVLARGKAITLFLIVL